jgi:hypothetical protein
MGELYTTAMRMGNQMQVIVIMTAVLSLNASYLSLFFWGRPASQWQLRSNFQKYLKFIYDRVRMCTNEHI